MIKESLKDKWLRSGISLGDTVLIHSNIARTVIEQSRCLGYRVTPEDVLKSLFDAVSPKGTLIFPLFNFDFTQGIPFDIRTSPSRMGVLTEMARMRPGAVRTGHPIYSFAAIGEDAKLFSSINNRSAYSDESPFGLLRKINGKIAVLDLPDSQSMTFYHHVEEINKVDYRYFKDFVGDYTDISGVRTKETYKIFVRDLVKGVVSHADPAGELLWSQGLYTGYRPNVDTGMRVIQSVDMFDFVTDLIQNNKALNNLYIIKKD